MSWWDEMNERFENQSNSNLIFKQIIHTEKRPPNLIDTTVLDYQELLPETRARTRITANWVPQSVHHAATELHEVSSPPQQRALSGFCTRHPVMARLGQWGRQRAAQSNWRASCLAIRGFPYVLKIIIFDEGSINLFVSYYIMIKCIVALHMTVSI